MTEVVSCLFTMSVLNQGARSPHPGVICMRIGLLSPWKEVAAEAGRVEPGGTAKHTLDSLHNKDVSSPKCQKC